MGSVHSLLKVPKFVFHGLKVNFNVFLRQISERGNIQLLRFEFDIMEQIMGHLS